MGAIQSMFGNLFGKPMKKDIRILMLGLKSAGKSTIIHKLKLGQLVRTQLAEDFVVETIQYKNTKFTLFDVGGPYSDKHRAIWTEYLKNTKCLIYVVDSNNREQITKARDELKQLLNEPDLRNVPVLVYANKIDLPNAMPATEVSNALDLNNIINHSWYIQSTCGTNGDGLYEGLDWLSEQYKASQKG